MEAGWVGEHTLRFGSRSCVSLSFAFFLSGGVRGGRGALVGGALFFQRAPEGAQDNGGLEETISHLLLCLFFVSGPTIHRQLSLNTTPESAWEGSYGDRVGQDGFRGWTATLTVCTLQLPPSVPTNQQSSVLELEDGKSSKAPSVASLRGRTRTGAQDFGHIAVSTELLCIDEAQGLTCTRKTLKH